MRAADVSRRTWTHATQRTKDAAQIAWLLFPVLQGDQVMEVDHGRGKSRGQKGRSYGLQQKLRRKGQG